MTEFVILALIGWTTSGLIVWRLFEAATQGILRLRGGSYTRIENSVWFWISAISLTVGLLLCLAVALISSSMLLGIIE